MSLVKTATKDALRGYRMKMRVESAGIECRWHKHLDRISNARYIWGGHLADATMHYTKRWEYGGKTYNFRHIFKAAGCRWDSARKVWWHSGVDHSKRREIMTAICREVSEKVA